MLLQQFKQSIWPEWGEGKLSENFPGEQKEGKKLTAWDTMG
jgi:hypothetical protein